MMRRMQRVMLWMHMEMDKEEVCRKILLENGGNDDDMNELREGMIIVSEPCESGNK